jgi:hypothetical protein
VTLALKIAMQNDGDFVDVTRLYTHMLSLAYNLYITVTANSVTIANRTRGHKTMLTQNYLGNYILQYRPEVLGIPNTNNMRINMITHRQHQ